MRLIDANELQEEYKKRHDGKRLLLIDVAPTVEPQRIKGKWKRTKANSGYNAEWVCSICGYTVYAEFCNYNYCSSCGSDMRGD